MVGLKMELVEALHPLLVLQYAIIIPFGVLIVYLVQNEIVRYSTRISKLPGPRGWPVVGNLFQVRGCLGETQAITMNWTRELFMHSFSISNPALLASK